MKGGWWRAYEQLVERRKIKMGVSRSKIEEIHMKNANAK